MLLKIEKMVYGGEGLAHLPADATGRGKAAFVPFVLEGEEAEASIVESKPSFARARLDKIVTSSAHRTEPPCPYYGSCGGCHYQHSGYDHQLEIKSAILRENLARLAKLDWEGEISVHRSEPWNYRNRTRLQVRTAPEFAIGYFKHASHELLPVEKCPISSILINSAIAAMWDLGKRGVVPAQIREMEFFASAADTELLVEVYLEGETKEKPLADFCDAISDALPPVVGVAMFRLERESHQFREPVQLGVAGESELIYQAAGTGYHVGAGSFFQTNRHLAETMISLVTERQSGKLALDLYAGVGLFAVSLARSFEKVIAVEASQYSFADLKTNAVRNVHAAHDTVDRYLARRVPKPDFVVVDPPRAGLGEKVTRALAKLETPRLTYVSCDPATLARDLRILLASGYRVEHVHLLDLFPQTFHIESLVRLVRS